MSTHTLSQDVANVSNSDQITLQPIGIVNSTIIEPRFGGWREHRSRIVISDAYATALQGLEDYSHLMIVFWMHYVCYQKILHVPQGKLEEVPEVGIFACRCPARPNPVGCTTVKLISVSGNTLEIEGLDAVDETPVIDIKPVTPQYDCVAPGDIKVPTWIFNLDY